MVSGKGGVSLPQECRPWEAGQAPVDGSIPTRRWASQVGLSAH